MARATKRMTPDERTARNIAAARGIAHKIEGAKITARRNEATILPTDFRLAKGDAALSTERGAKVYRARASSSNPLLDLLSRKSINTDEYDQGRRFGSLYERATREGGTVNLDSAGGGFNGGQTHAHCEAMADLHAIVRILGATEYDRLNRARVLIKVCGERKSIRDIAQGSRSRQTASNLLVSALQRMVAASMLAAAA